MNFFFFSGMCIAALVAFLWIVIMRWVAGIMVWVTLLGLVGVISFGIWYCYDEYAVSNSLVFSKLVLKCVSAEQHVAC